MPEFSDLMKPSLFELYRDHIRAENHDLDSLRNVWRTSLNNGRCILQKKEDIDTYLACYFALHFCKLDHFLEKINFDALGISSVNLFDWGCGSATGSISFINRFYEKINIKKIILIEPSKIAINRGKEYIDLVLYSEEFQPIIQIWNRTFENLMTDKSDLIQTNSATNIHLFSNVLDINTIDINNLCNLILKTQTGLNYFLCVSTTGQAAANASARIRQFYSQLCDNLDANIIINLQSYRINTPPIFFINTGTTKCGQINMFGGFFSINLVESIETNQLENQITQLNKNIVELSHELQQREQTIDEQNRNLTDANSRINQLQNQITKIKQATNSNSDFKTTMNLMVNNKITELNACIIEKEYELQKEKEFIHEQSSKLADADSKIKQLEKRITQLNNNIKDSSIELQKNKQTLDEQNRKLADANRRISQLQNQSVELKKNKQTLDEQNRKLADANSKINQLQNQIEILNTNIKEKNIQLVSFEKELFDLNEKQDSRMLQLVNGISKKRVEQELKIKNIESNLVSCKNFSLMLIVMFFIGLIATFLLQGKFL